MMTEPLSPKLIPFELLNVKAEARLLVVPADRLMEPCVLATVARAVMVEPTSPKLTLLEFEKTNADAFSLVVPALRFTAESALTLAVTCDEPLIPKVTPLLLAKNRERLKKSMNRTLSKKVL